MSLAIRYSAISLASFLCFYAKKIGWLGTQSVTHGSLPNFPANREFYREPPFPS